ncbi:MAG: ATP-binding protein, partial [Bacteroidota bacterium]
PDQALQLEFGAYRETKANRTVFFVKDNGIGFSPKQGEKVFTVFSRLPEATKQEGHGIGLSIVKKAIELQGGTIWANAQVGEGATFYFSFPDKPKKTSQIKN